jgi:hypothetical protein
VPQQSAEAFRGSLMSCAVPRWESADARRWWDRVGGMVTERREERIVSADGATIEIDFVQRLRPRAWQLCRRLRELEAQALSFEPEYKDRLWSATAAMIEHAL